MEGSLLRADLSWPVFQNPLVGMQEEDWFIGDEAQKKRGALNLQYPISRGTITNWDNMEKVGSASAWGGHAHGALGDISAALAPGEGGAPASRALWASLSSRSL